MDLKDILLEAISTIFILNLLYFPIKDTEG